MQGITWKLCYARDNKGNATTTLVPGMRSTIRVLKIPLIPGGEILPYLS